MWHPPEGIKHALPPVRWPTVEESASALLFQPLRVGAIDLADRTWVPAMVPWRATEEGFVTEDVLDWYDRFARGQPGALVVEATGVRDVPSGPLLRIGHDRFVPGLARLVETVRRASSGRTRLFIQILDFLAIRRRPERDRHLRRFLELGPSHRAALAARGLAYETDGDARERLVELPDEELRAILDARDWESLQYGFRERITDLDNPRVRDLPKVLPGVFAEAARRAKVAGFDGVELHYAHAYTMASFLSALNVRSDGYGGPLGNRLRLPLEVIAAVRARVGPQFVVGCRYLAEECIEGGNGAIEAEAIGVALARASVDYLSLSRGGKFEDAEQPQVGWAAYPYTGPSGYECMPTVLSDARGPFGRNVEATARVRAAVRAAGHGVPIVVTGGIYAFDQAERLLVEGAADIVGAARQSLADPDWWRKVRLGRGSEVRRCLFTNYCEGLDQKHKQVTCKLWDHQHLDPAREKLTRDGRRRLLPPLWPA